LCLAAKVSERLSLITELRKDAAEPEVERIRRRETEDGSTGHRFSEEHYEGDDHHDGIHEPFA